VKPRDVGTGGEASHHFWDGAPALRVGPTKDPEPTKGAGSGGTRNRRLRIDYVCLLPIERITDPATLDTANIAALVSNGSRPILQFSKPGFSDRTLDTVNGLCEQFGDALDVRFFGFYGEIFDCRVLRRLPAVSSLALDCLNEASHVDEVAHLPHLRRLSLGIYLMQAHAILAAPNLRGLRELSLGSTKTSRVDLSPLEHMTELSSLYLEGQNTGIEAVGQCAALRKLQLRMLRRGVSVSFVNRIEGLQSLSLILGGRDDLDEITHNDLRRLEVIRVRGLTRIEPERFGRLERLFVEDQAQLRGLWWPETGFRGDCEANGRSRPLVSVAQRTVRFCGDTEDGSGGESPT
jgi:hypothetical protein